MPRLRIPRADAIKRYCAEKGWGPQELAQHAAIAITTAYKAFNGVPMFRCKLARVATSLKKPVGLILDLSDPEAIQEENPQQKIETKPPRVQAPSFKVTITIEGNADVLTDPEISDRLRRFFNLIGAPDQEPDDIRFGSVHVTLQLYMQHSILAIDALVTHHLIELGITAITLHDPYPRIPIVSHVDLQNAYYSEIAAYNAKAPKATKKDGFTIAKEMAHLVTVGRRFDPFNRFPMLYTVTSYYQAGILDVDILSPMEWILRPTSSVPSTLPESVFQC